VTRILCILNRALASSVGGVCGSWIANNGFTNMAGLIIGSSVRVDVNNANFAQSESCNKNILEMLYITAAI